MIGRPVITNAKTGYWDEPGRGRFTLPAGTPGVQLGAGDMRRLGVPLAERRALLASLQRSPGHVLVLLDGRVRVLPQNVLDAAECA